MIDARHIRALKETVLRWNSKVKIKETGMEAIVIDNYRHEIDCVAVIHAGEDTVTFYSLEELELLGS